MVLVEVGDGALGALADGIVGLQSSFLFFGCFSTGPVYQLGHPYREVIGLARGSVEPAPRGVAEYPPWPNDLDGGPILTEQLWGGETTKAVDNFPVSGAPVPVPVVRWLGRVKAAAAEVNGELGLLDGELAERIAAAGKAVGAGEHDDQFPVDVFQTGSGTSSNMNANEVIANLAGDGRPSQRPRQYGPVLQRRLPLRRAPGGAGRGHP